MTNENCKLFNISETATNNDFHYHFSLQIDSIFQSIFFFICLLKNKSSVTFWRLQKSIISSSPFWLSPLSKMKKVSGTAGFCWWLHTVWRLFQKRYAHTEQDIYVFDNYKKKYWNNIFFFVLFFLLFLFFSGWGNRWRSHWWKSLMKKEIK